MFIIIKMFMYAISQRSALIIKKVLMFPRLCLVSSTIVRHRKLDDINRSFVGLYLRGEHCANYCFVDPFFLFSFLLRGKKQYISTQTEKNCMFDQLA